MNCSKFEMGSIIPVQLGNPGEESYERVANIKLIGILRDRHDKPLDVFLGINPDAVQEDDLVYEISKHSRNKDVVGYCTCAVPKKYYSHENFEI